MTASYDGGRTWTTPIRVNDNASPVDEFQPNLSAAPNGVVSVAFYDRRLACPANGTTEAADAGLALDTVNPNYTSALPPYGANNYWSTPYPILPRRPDARRRQHPFDGTYLGPAAEWSTARQRGESRLYVYWRLFRQHRDRLGQLFHLRRHIQCKQQSTLPTAGDRHGAATIGKARGCLRSPRASLPVGARFRPPISWLAAFGPYELRPVAQHRMT